MTIIAAAMPEDQLAGIAARAEQWAAQDRDPLDGGPCPIRREDVEALLSDAYWHRRTQRHHVVLVQTAQEAARRVRRLRGDPLASEINEAMRHVGAELGDGEERTN